MRTVRATRYVTPLREGGSLPAIVEADDSGLYVVKFRAAGHGVKALLAEWITGELARAAGLLIPEIVLVEVDDALGRNEPDSEIRELVRGSAGLNLGLDYLPGSLTFDPVAGPAPTAGEASAIVWFDAFTTNVDRTARNPNLLCWHRRLYLIDHGASLYAHHDWAGAAESSRSRFAAVKDHVLLPWATELAAAGEKLAARLGRDTVQRVLDRIPDEWLPGDPHYPGIGEHREAYARFLAGRLQAAPDFLEEAERARGALV